MGPQHRRETPVEAVAATREQQDLVKLLSKSFGVKRPGELSDGDGTRGIVGCNSPGDYQAAALPPLHPIYFRFPPGEFAFREVAGSL
jgi:hypothetical protein